MAKPRFSNMDTVSTQKTSEHFKRWGQDKIWKRQGRDYSFTVPNAEPDMHFLHHNRTQPSLTWIGHSTFLIQLAGVNIVTDPVWAGQMAFQRRLASPGVQLRDMPPVDLVLVSHSHYDHLHISSLRRLGGSKTILVPAGLASKLRIKGFSRVHELHWWESFRFRGLKLTFVPSQHWARRNPWDMNASHWGGWVIQPEHGLDHEPGEGTLQGMREQHRSPYVSSRPDTTHHPEPDSIAPADPVKLSKLFRPGLSRPQTGRYPTLYFAGDSGYFQGFADIGSRFSIDVALLPIGAYDPEAFMSPQHTTPEQALQAFLDLKAGLFVPMHYGSFKLADDTPREALERLENGRRSLGIDPARVVLLPHGETWRLEG